MPPHYLLPTELWLEIFRWATGSNGGASGVDACTTAYIPFQRRPVETRDPNLAIRTTLALVCRRWRSLTTEFLYKDIKIRHGARALRRVLERTGHDEGYAKWVRRVVLPYPSTVTGPSNELESIEILKLCIHLETLLRPPFVLPDSLRFEFDAGCLPLPSLRRLEWWHHHEAERTGGINSLSTVLRSAPNLQYLFIGGVIGLTRAGTESESLSLPALQTVRLYGINPLLSRQIVLRWSMPALTRIVLDTPLVEPGLRYIWETFGPQLRAVEFGNHLRFLTHDYLTPCWQACPNLNEMNYFIFFTAHPEATAIYPSITTIGLHASVNSFLVDGESIWSLLEWHFDAFTGGMLPSLRRLRLHGQWRGIVSHTRFMPLSERMRTRNCIIEFADED